MTFHKCPQTNERIDDYLSDEMRAEERAAFEHHIAGCSECDELVRQSQRILRIATPPFAPELTEASSGANYGLWQQLDRVAHERHPIARLPLTPSREKGVWTIETPIRQFPLDLYDFQLDASVSSCVCSLPLVFGDSGDFELCPRGVAIAADELKLPTVSGLIMLQDGDLVAFDLCRRLDPDRFELRSTSLPDDLVPEALLVLKHE